MVVKNFGSPPTVFYPPVGGKISSIRVYGEPPFSTPYSLPQRKFHSLHPHKAYDKCLVAANVKGELLISSGSLRVPF